MRTRLNKLLFSGDLPTLPEVAMRVVEIARQDDPDFDELAATVRTDPAISARLLKTANSALFGRRTQVSSVESAIPALGASLVRTLVLGFSLGNRVTGDSLRLRHHAQRIWRSSLIQATTAELLAQRISASDPPTWFLAGMLQDIGRLAMLAGLKNQYADVVGTSGGFQAEKKSEQCAFGFTHVDVSVELCHMWNLEDGIVEAISRHHAAAADAAQDLPEDESHLAVALAVSSQTADYFSSVVHSRECKRSVIDDSLIRHFGVPPDELVELFSEVDRRVSEVAISMGIDIGDAPPLEDILAEAQAALAKLAVQSQLEAVQAHRKLAESKRRLKTVLNECKELKETACRDSLTGTYNRAFLEDAINLELKRFRESGRPLGFLFLDVDRFKQLNDTHGHQQGDQTLCEVAEVLKTSVRPSDFVVRYGGDEFLVILIDVAEFMVKQIAERIRSRIAGLASQGNDQAPTVSSSIGALICDPSGRKHPTCETILREVDGAMYQAKKGGGNAVAFVRLEGRKSRTVDAPAHPRHLEESRPLNGFDAGPHRRV